MDEVNSQYNPKFVDKVNSAVVGEKKLSTTAFNTLTIQRFHRLNLQMLLMIKFSNALIVVCFTLVPMMQIFFWT
jgi:hypothetical protein